jgi:hypothetical protein
LKRIRNLRTKIGDKQKEPWASDQSQQRLVAKTTNSRSSMWITQQCSQSQNISLGRHPNSSFRAKSKASTAITPKGTLPWSTLPFHPRNSTSEPILYADNIKCEKKWPSMPIGDESPEKKDDTSQCNYDNFCEHCEALSNVTFKRLPHIIILVRSHFLLLRVICCWSDVLVESVSSGCPEAIMKGNPIFSHASSFQNNPMISCFQRTYQIVTVNSMQC